MKTATIRVTLPRLAAGQRAGHKLRVTRNPARDFLPLEEIELDYEAVEARIEAALDSYVTVQYVAVAPNGAKTVRELRNISVQEFLPPQLEGDLLVEVNGITSDEAAGVAADQDEAACQEQQKTGPPGTEDADQETEDGHSDQTETEP